MICKHCKKEIPDGCTYCCWCGKAVAQVKKAKAYHPNGSGYCYKPKGSKTWTARVADMAHSRIDPETGRFLRKVIQKGGFRTEMEARSWCIDFYQQKTSKAPAPPLNHYWDLFENGEMLQLSLSKQASYRIAWKKLSSIANTKVDALTISDLRTVVSRNAPTYAPAQDMKNLLNHLYKLAAADRYVERELPSFIVIPKHVEAEKRTFTQDDISLLWSAFDEGDRDACWPLLMIYTGMMPGETRKATIGMVDLTARTITGAGLKTTVRKSAIIHFPEIIVPVLQRVIGDRAEGLLFPQTQYFIEKGYYSLLARLGIRKLEPYCCRHTMATALAVDRNVGAETLRKIMRWSKTSNMAGRYVHPDDAAINEALEFTRPVASK